MAGAAKRRTRLERSVSGTRRGASGPSGRAVVALMASMVAIAGSSLGPPTLDAFAVGDVVLGPGESADHEVRVRLTANGASASEASIDVEVRAANGLLSAPTSDVTIRHLTAHAGSQRIAPGQELPLARCPDGCEFRFRIRIEAGPSVLPGSVIRYEAQARLGWLEHASVTRGDVAVAIDGPGSTIPAPAWSILVGIAALIAGIRLGPRVDLRLGPGRRRWPAIALAGLVLATSFGMLLGAIAGAPGLGGAWRPGPLPIPVLARGDVWSPAVLVVLGWGMLRGLRHWSTDGGWLLGVATVAVIGPGGLWLILTLTMGGAFQPLVAAGPLVLLGGLGGLVLGQAWRSEPAAVHDRWWAAFAVLGYGTLMAAFAFVVAQAVRASTDPTTALVALAWSLAPLLLVAGAFRGWLRGDQGLAIGVCVVTALVFLFALFATVGMVLPGPAASWRIDLLAAAMMVTILAAVVAAATSFHRVRSPSVARSAGPALAGRLQDARVSPPVR